VVDGRQLISVRTEVVLDALVEDLAAIVAGRMERPLPQNVEEQLRDVTGDYPPALTRVAQRVARAGFLARIVECERFARSRDPAPGVAAELSGGPAAVTALASREPLDRPDPADGDAVTWRVPGPGGHVRHYLALRAVGAELARDAIPAAAVGSDGPAALKRAWVHGFLLACVPPGVGGVAAPEGPATRHAQEPS
jgi:hypothetical protein